MTIALIFGAIIIILVVIFSKMKGKEHEALKKEFGLDIMAFKELGRYVGGHPDIDTPIERLRGAIKDGNLMLFLELVPPTHKGNIPLNKIKKISIEDESTVTKRITVGRLLAVGVFALAWKKKQLEEHVYVVIEWNDGRFDHETIFEYEGTGSRESGNIIRNWMLKAMR
jgi:hypothetical protein